VNGMGPDPDHCRPDPMQRPPWQWPGVVATRERPADQWGLYSTTVPTPSAPTNGFVEFIGMGAGAG
jgi:hypothetical protein